MLSDRDFPQVIFEAPLPDGSDMTKKEREGEYAYLFHRFDLEKRLEQRRNAEVTFWKAKGLVRFAREASGLKVRRAAA